MENSTKILDILILNLFLMVKLTEKKVICRHCKVEFSYNWSVCSLSYHLNAKNTIIDVQTICWGHDS